MKKTDWYGLYGGSWKGEIVDKAFKHPAKYSRDLIRQIYRHCLEKGYLQKGDRVVDPFGGVALGALDAMRLGLHWRGVELEPTFVVFGQGMDCPGFDAAFWKRYQGRGSKWQDLGICPDCGDLLDTPPPMRYWFGRYSRAIPTEGSHRYCGNIEIWQQYGFEGTAELLQSDSRWLCEVLAGGEGLVSSPPYADSVNNNHGHGIDATKFKGADAERDFGSGNSNITNPQRYGKASGQMGAMKEGDHTAVVSSPPYVDSVNSKNSGIDWEKGKPDYPGRKFHKNRVQMLQRHHDDFRYGDAVGQLGAMKEGEHTAVISSPPYGDAVSGQGEGPGARYDTVYHSQEKSRKLSNQSEYGQSEGNLGNMAMADGVVGSPPFENSFQDVNSTEGRIEVARKMEIDNCEYVSPIDLKRVNGCNQQYGGSEGQMGNEMGNTFWEAARLVVEQCYKLLEPGSVAVWVTGDYARNGERVLFGEQWLALCEAVGFELEEWIVAWKTEYAPTHVALLDTVMLNGEVAEAGTAVRYKPGKKNDGVRPAQKDRVSFFRRLANERNPKASILNEDVIIVRKR